MADDNLDAHLFPKDSPYTNREPYVTAYDFDVTHQIPAGGINYTNLTASSRAATAVISLSGEKGTFKDIQAAINYVNSLGGGRILVLPGTYTITTPIVIYSDIRLEGLSRNDCIFDFNHTTNNISLSGSPTATNIKIFSLTLKNCDNLVATVNLGNGLVIEVTDCLFMGNISTGYDLACVSGGQIRIRDCRSESSGGFFYNDSIDRSGEVSNCVIVNPSGIVFFGASAVFAGRQTTYSNNYVSSVSGANAIVSGKFYQCKFVNNIFVHSGSPTAISVDLSNTTECYFSNNIVTNFARVPVDLNSSSKLFFNQNLISGIATSGLDINGTVECTFTGNHILGNLNSTPVVLLTNTFKLIFSGNFISSDNLAGTSQDGMKLVNGDQTVVTGNFIRGSSAGAGTSYGVNIDANSSVSVVVGNYLQGLTAPFLNSGAGNVVASNMT